MKLMIATSILAMTGLFAQTATPPAAGDNGSKMVKKGGKHKKPHTKKTKPTT